MKLKLKKKRAQVKKQLDIGTILMVTLDQKDLLA